MKYVMIALMLATPVSAGNNAPGTSDPTVTAPIVLQSGQIQRICFLYREGEIIADPARCGGRQSGDLNSGPRLRLEIERGEIEPQCNTANCNPKETDAAFDKRKANAPKKIRVK